VTKTLRTLFAAATVLALSVSAVRAADADVVETAKAAGKFKTLLTACEAAGLVEALKGKGPITVFAPTDDAFAAVPKEKLDALLKDKEALKKVLLYHVVSGNVMAADAMKLDGKAAPTLQGAEIKVKVDGKNVMINDAKVIMADVKASNGVIHVIDKVILPPTK
jgi:uncharacterized surface protein with fasciclin (FAS1) repeats